MIDSVPELHQALGDWSSHVNGKYVGKIDRVHLPSADSWTPEYYIDHYLQARGRPVTQWNRDVVVAALGKFVGHAPFRREALDAFLDNTWKLAKA